jgi:Putative Ig domain
VGGCHHALGQGLAAARASADQAATAFFAHQQGTLAFFRDQLTVGPATLPEIHGCTSYSQPITASGGAPPYTFSSSGTLPPALTVSTTGAIGGTPSAKGTFSFTVTVTDSAGRSASQSYTLSEDCQPAPAASTPPTPSTEPLG